MLDEIKGGVMLSDFFFVSEISELAMECWLFNYIVIQEEGEILIKDKNEMKKSKDSLSSSSFTVRLLGI